MKCPCCDVELSQEFYQKIVVYRCPACVGRLITVGGLRSLSADRTLVNRLWATAQNGNWSAGAVCPGCQAPMRRVTLPVSRLTLELDVCCSCQLVWFDPSELEQIPFPEPEVPDELPLKAREAIALEQAAAAEVRINREFRAVDSDNEPDEAWKYLLGMLGVPVELDAPKCRRLPWVTWLIAVVCVAVFALSYKNLQTVIDVWGYIPAEWSRHGGLTIFTSMFLHGGVLHLLGNLYFLLILGDNVEDELSRFKYVILLVISGLSAVLLYTLFNSGSMIPCVGASGFISGVIACYAVCFPNVRMSFMIRQRSYFSISSQVSWLAMPAWCVFALWIGFQILMASLAKSGQSGVAYMAHLGGAVPGVLFGIYYHLRLKHSSEEAEKSLADLDNVKDL